MEKFVFTKEEFEKIQQEFSKNMDKKENFDHWDKIFEEKIDKQIDYLHRNGMEALYKLNEVNYIIHQQFHAFLEGKFRTLHEASVGLNEGEVYQLITSNEVYERVLKLDNKPTSRAIPRDCAEAIVGTVITTIGAIGVGGPVGLGIWLVAKGYSTYQLIRACA